MKALRQLSSSGPAHAGTARIIVLRGWSLLAADKGGTSDPYVVVQVAGGKKEKTSVIKGTVNPVWDETLELSVPDYASPVYLEVWDHDKIGANDSLGKGEILLGQCEPGVPTLLTVAIDTQGTVEVEVTWVPAERQQHGYAPAVTVDNSPMSVRRGLPSSLTQSQSAVELSPASRKANGHDETQMGVATVRVLRGSNLRAADRGGKSDPYVVVQAAGGKQLVKTSVKKGTVNPVWDETLELSVPNPAEPLALSVWDHDNIGRNDSLGSGVISLAQCTPNVVTPLTLSLFEQGESQQGTIFVEVLWRPPEKRAAPSPATPSPVPLLSPAQLASRDAARKAAAARQAAEHAAEAAMQAEWECEQMREAAAAAKVAAGVAKAARRVAAKEAEAAEEIARVAAQQEAAETIAREKAARRAAGHIDVPPPELQEYHRLVIHVEHCMAERPSPVGSLQGAAERCARARPSPTSPPTSLGFTPRPATCPPGDMHRYPSCFQHFREAVLSHKMCGSVPSASPEVVIVANNLGYRPPGAEDNTTARGELVWPRIGSFEVSVTLYDTRTGQRWGPITVFSKIASCKVRRTTRASCLLIGSRPRMAGLHAFADTCVCGGVAVSRDRKVDGASVRTACRMARLAAAAQLASAVGARQNTGS